MSATRRIISKKMLAEFPEVVVQAIRSMQERFPNIKSLKYIPWPETQQFTVSEGCTYQIVLGEAISQSVETQATHNVGAAGLFQKIGSTFTAPVGSFVLCVWYYDRYFLDLYNIQPERIKARSKWPLLEIGNAAGENELSFSHVQRREAQLLKDQERDTESTLAKLHQNGSRHQALQAEVARLKAAKQPPPSPPVGDEVLPEGEMGLDGRDPSATLFCLMRLASAMPDGNSSSQALFAEAREILAQAIPGQRAVQAILTATGEWWDGLHVIPKDRTFHDLMKSYPVGSRWLAALRSNRGQACEMVGLPSASGSFFPQPHQLLSSLTQRAATLTPAGLESYRRLAGRIALSKDLRLEFPYAPWPGSVAFDWRWYDLRPPVASHMTCLVLVNVYE